jgi:hypothetical protein
MKAHLGEAGISRPMLKSREVLVVLRFILRFILKVRVIQEVVIGDVK